MDNEMKSTPLPWTYEPQAHTPDDIWSGTRLVACAENGANATLIVRCVNSQHLLIEALEFYADRKLTTNDLYFDGGERARAALKQARGG